MTAMRLISLPMHGALELALGLGLMAAPFAFGVGAAGTVVAFLVGALIVGLALLTAADERSATLPVSTHFAADQGLVLGLLVAAALVGADGDIAAGLVLAVAGVIQLALTVTTRYVARA